MPTTPAAAGGPPRAPKSGGGGFFQRLTGKGKASGKPGQATGGGAGAMAANGRLSDLPPTPCSAMSVQLERQGTGTEYSGGDNSPRSVSTSASASSKLVSKLAKMGRKMIGGNGGAPQGGNGAALPGPGGKPRPQELVSSPSASTVSPKGSFTPASRVTSISTTTTSTGAAPAPLVTPTASSGAGTGARSSPALPTPGRATCGGQGAQATPTAASAATPVGRPATTSTPTPRASPPAVAAASPTKDKKPATVAELEVGSMVVAREDFMSNSKAASKVVIGQRGLVTQIDKDGDFLIRFEDHAERQWLLKKYVHRVRLATVEERQAPLSGLGVTVRGAAGPDGERNLGRARAVTVSSSATENAMALALGPQHRGEWMGTLLRSTAVSSTNAPGSGISDASTAVTTPGSSSAGAADRIGIKQLFMASVASSTADISGAGGPGLANLLLSSVASSGATGQPDSDAPPPLVLRESQRRRGFYPLGDSAVWLHIYDVSGSTLHLVNNIARPVGTGAFHAGVEVYGQEWSFGYAPEKRTGVYSCRPRCNTAHKYRESLPMGVTSLSEDDVRKLIEVLRTEWLGCSYDLLVRNCCHFSDTLCRKVGVGPCPEWVTNLAGAGARIIGGVDQAVASAHAARGLAAAIDDHYQITPTVEALLARDYTEMVDEDYIRQKAQDLWAGTVESFQPVGTFAESALASAQKAMTLESMQESFWGMWSRGTQGPGSSSGWMKQEKQDVRIVKVSMPNNDDDDTSDGSPWSSNGNPSPLSAAVALAVNSQGSRRISPGSARRHDGSILGDFALEEPTDCSPKEAEGPEIEVGCLVFADFSPFSPKATEPEDDDEAPLVDSDAPPADVSAAEAASSAEAGAVDEDEAPAPERVEGAPPPGEQRTVAEDARLGVDSAAPRDEAPAPAPEAALCGRTDGQKGAAAPDAYASSHSHSDGAPAAAPEGGGPPKSPKAPEASGGRGSGGDGAGERQPSQSEDDLAL